MHELAVTQEIIKILLEECKKNLIENPKKVSLSIGSFTTYKKEPVEYYFEILKKEHKLLQNTKIEAVEVQARIKCRDCNKESVLEDNSFIICPFCDSTNTEIVEGKDLYIKHIDF